MKKLSFILLMAALALPMMAQTKAEEDAAMANYRHKAVPSFTLQGKKAPVAVLRDEIPNGYASVTLSAADVWGDGTGYQMLLDADATAYGNIFPVSGAFALEDVSDEVYAEFEYKIPENADGALTTSNILVDEAVTILIPAGTYDWCITNPTPGDALWIASANGSIPGRYDDFVFENGAAYTFYVTYGGYNDQVDLEIYNPFAPVMPENLTVNPTANTADVAWENTTDPMFNLRYREYNPNTAQQYFWGFENDEELAGWLLYDADGDGYNWRIDGSASNAHSGTASIVSDSYYSGVRTPDNWLFSPVVPLNGTLTFWSKNYSSSYLDHFVVYAAVGDAEDVDVDNLDAFVPVSDVITPAGTWGQYTIDLSQFEGAMGRFAFRHFDCSDLWRVYVDDITLNVPGDDENEWIVVEGIQGNEFTIEGLNPETTYEVEVQAVSANGRTSDWAAEMFTTLEAGEEPTEYCARPECAYAITDFETVTVTITNNEPEATVVYSVYCGEELIEEGTFTGAQHQIQVTGPGDYVVHAVATMQGYLDSPDGGVFFTILPNDAPPTAIDELAGNKTVANVRYFNALGQEMQSANGMTIVVTTYTDGTTSTAKVVK